MDTLPSHQISVIEPIGAAIDKTKEILFQPFDIGKWFTIGFCAWLATLGSSGGPNGGGGGTGSDGRGQDLQREIHSIKDGFMENAHVIIPIAIAVFFVILIISLAVMWVKSRGQFMFLHCVARNAAEVKNPWKRYAAQANSLFLFKLVLWLIGTLLGLVLVIPIALLVIPMVKTQFEMLMFAPLLGISLLAFGAILLGFAMLAVTTLTKDFVVPVMYINGGTVTQGWRIFWRLCSENMSKFILFLLFLLIVNIVLGMIIVLVVLATCCCAGCILAIPYVGTVLMLPILVWRRAYSALFLAQFGAAFDVFAIADPVVVPMDVMPGASTESGMQPTDPGF